MDKESEQAILTLEEITFQGEKDFIGPLNMVISQYQDKIVQIESPKDQLKFMRIVKGVELPDTGRIFKRGSDTTGWVVPDGIVCVVKNSRFFSRTVRGEIAFAADVARTKDKIKANNILPPLLKVSGLENKMVLPIDHLDEFEKILLSLACAFIMLPQMVILLNPQAGCKAAQRAELNALFRLGRETVGCACLQVVSREAWAVPVNRDAAPGNVA